MPTVITSEQPLARRFAQSATLLIALGALAAIMAAIAGRASALDPQPEPLGFGAVSQLSDQSLQLNVSLVSTPGYLPPSPCRVTLAFCDANGTALLDRAADVRPGGTTSRVLSRRVEGRSLARPVVRVSDPAACPTVATLEVIDTASGRTTLLYPQTQF